MGFPKEQTQKSSLCVRKYPVNSKKFFKRDSLERQIYRDGERKGGNEKMLFQIVTHLPNGRRPGGRRSVWVSYIGCMGPRIWIFPCFARHVNKELAWDSISQMGCWCLCCREWLNWLDSSLSQRFTWKAELLREETHTHTDFLFTIFTPQMAAMARSLPGRSQKPGFCLVESPVPTGFPTCGKMNWTIFNCFPSHIPMELNQKWSSEE